LNKCRGVSHFHNLPLQIQKKRDGEKRKRKKKGIQQEKEKQIKKTRVDPLIHWIGYLLYEKTVYLGIKREVELS